MTCRNRNVYLASDEKERRAKQAALGKQLRDTYSAQPTDDVPAGFIDLLKQADERSALLSNTDQ